MRKKESPSTRRRQWSRLRVLVVAVLTIFTFGATLQVATPVAYAASGEQRLSPGERLNSGQYLVSSNGEYRLTMQHDGNLVLRRGNGSVYWHSGTHGRHGAFATYQSEGNFVIYQRGRAVWHANSVARRPTDIANVRLGNTGELQVGRNVDLTEAYDPLGRLSYTNPNVKTLQAGERLTAGQSITIEYDSGDIINSQKTILTMQHDGNLVLRSNTQYGGGSDEVPVVWNSRTNGKPGAQAVMQYDGNFVIYHNGRAIWNTRPTGKSGTVLAVTSWGDLRIADAKGYGIKAIHDS